jgi:hypothetical protein
MDDPRGLGQQHLDPNWFRSVALHLDAAGTAGAHRGRVRAGSRRSAEAAARQLAPAWSSPDGDRTVSALTAWCGASVRSESDIDLAYEWVRALAGLARTTAAIIERVEPYERNWIGNAEDWVNEIGGRFRLNVRDTLMVDSDIEAQAERDRLDTYNRARAAASEERARALQAWSDGLECTVNALDEMTRRLSTQTVAVPDDLLPRNRLTPAEAALDLQRRWCEIRERRAPVDGADGPAIRREWSRLDDPGKIAWLRCHPDEVDRYLTDVTNWGGRDTDPVLRDLRRLADAARGRGEPVPRPVAVALNAAAVADFRHRGVPPLQYKNELKLYWQNKAYFTAGIDDPDGWQPDNGAAANRPTIEAVYQYYRRLALDHPDLQWAAMGATVGPGFAAAFFDFNDMRAFARKLADVIDGLPEPVRNALPKEVRDLRNVAAMSDEDVHFFESMFLNMQRKIFDDQAMMHEAYLRGGMAAIQELLDADVIDPNTAQGWDEIDRGAATGDRTLLDAGTLKLVEREQTRTIRDQYNEMRDHPKTGQAFTYLITIIGRPSIPGARSMAQTMPFEVPIETPGPERFNTPASVFGHPVPHLDEDNPAQGTVHIQTPLARYNIADVDDRWAYIVADTFPTFQRMRNADQVRPTLETPLDQRIEESRMRNHMADLLRDLNRWRVRIEQ